MLRGILRILLYPVSLIYGLVIYIRNYLFDNNILSAQEYAVPLICVGNITVGGTGKTPHVEYIAGLLLKEFKVAVLSRGYKRSKGGFAIVEENGTPGQFGDEPLQVKRKLPGIVVAVDGNRRKGIKKILELYPETDVIIMDDGFQHRWVTPGLAILLTDFNRLITKDFLLPYGRLREHRFNKRRADIILVTKTPEHVSPIERRIIVREMELNDNQNLYFTSTKYLGLARHDGSSSSLTLAELNMQGKEILLLTGIANAEPLYDYIKSINDRVTHLRFSDHHMFSEKDILNILKLYHSMTEGNRCFITTEKDYTRLLDKEKLKLIFDDNFYYLPISVIFQNDDQEEFDNLIVKYVRKNKSNRIVS